MTLTTEYKFEGEVWHTNSIGGWYFISLPKELSIEIRNHLKGQEQGWGRLKVKAKVNLAMWETALWFDTKRNTYLLPIKSKIRKSENIEIGSQLVVSVRI